MKNSYYHFECLDSTNDWCKAHLDVFDPKVMSIVSADVQTAGRGQYGRTWLSAKSETLVASFTFFIPIDYQVAYPLTTLMAECVIELLAAEGISAKMKLPNDVLVEGKKIAGILCETVPHHKQLAIVMGLGFNVNSNEDFCRQIDQPTTSMKIEKGSEWPLEEVLKQLTDTFITAIELKMGLGEA